MLAGVHRGTTGWGTGAGLLITLPLFVLFVSREDRLPQGLGLSRHFLWEAQAGFLWESAFPFGFLFFLVPTGGEEGRPLLALPTGTLRGGDRAIRASRV